MSETLSRLRPLADHRPLRPIVGGTRIGHVHLKVADLERALSFYCGVLGFEVTQRREGAAFISAGGYHHHIALNTWESLGGAPPAPGSTGLYHLAILYPTRRDLADALRRVMAADIELDGASEKSLLIRRADDGIRTHDPWLGKPMLYQLSYVRVPPF